MILVATDGGLHVVSGDGTARAEDLAGREVGAPAADGEGWWAIVEGRELWRGAEALDIEHDVHQVHAPSGHPGQVLVAAFDGFGMSRERRDLDRENDGLHAHYCRAVAGDTVILSASAGHQGRRAGTVPPVTPGRGRVRALRG
jgi:hypothetical protein